MLCNFNTPGKRILKSMSCEEAKASFRRGARTKHLKQSKKDQGWQQKLTPERLKLTSRLLHVHHFWLHSWVQWLTGVSLQVIEQFSVSCTKYRYAWTQSTFCWRATGRKIFLKITSELDFHIWNTNSQSFGRAKSETKMTAMEGSFVRQFQSSSILLKKYFLWIFTENSSGKWKLSRETKTDVQDNIGD